MAHVRTNYKESLNGDDKKRIPQDGEYIMMSLWLEYGIRYFLVCRLILGFGY